jgi:hypothetical protein
LRNFDKLGGCHATIGLEYPVECGFGIKAALVGNACQSMVFIFTLPDFLLESLDPQIVDVLIEIDIHSIVQQMRTSLFRDSEIAGQEFEI